MLYLHFDCTKREIDCTSDVIVACAKLNGFANCFQRIWLHYLRIWLTCFQCCEFECTRTKMNLLFAILPGKTCIKLKTRKSELH